MATSPTDIKERLRKERTKQAVTQAMQSQWDAAVETNRSILQEFPDDVEAYNRLGKALMELGRNKEAVDAFKKALQYAPHNAIALKNLDRLSQIGERAKRVPVKATAAPQTFIEESGKAGRTSLVNLAPPKVLLKLSPGDVVELKLEGIVLKVTDAAGGYIGQVEPKLSSRLAKLIKGGNRYEASVTSVGKSTLGIIIREKYQHPSQAGIVSFPTKGGTERAALPSAVAGYEAAEGEEEAEVEEAEKAEVKDWSNDDTEPGDDEAFSPVLHRIIDAGGEAGGEEEEGEREREEF